MRRQIFLVDELVAVVCDEYTLVQEVHQDRGENTLKDMSIFSIFLEVSDN